MINSFFLCLKMADELVPESFFVAGDEDDINQVADDIGKKQAKKKRNKPDNVIRPVYRLYTPQQATDLLNSLFEKHCAPSLSKIEQQSKHLEKKVFLESLSNYQSVASLSPRPSSIRVLVLCSSAIRCVHVIKYCPSLALTLGC